ncbi:GIY-YIG nuclease family protein [Candidatus Nanohalobium constans]|uniref:GIY-YIG nuclease family protein n=1 Tax=Candidatus Nanohalobium constans TaxID=2565781 RepID=A0A5Q0UFN6_9ARCH|nr:GIY-YIG nuclease family protein [Candidatus Nanohalobium constans]QGA80433.1 GIY-YIG nuclease family protein [Candidatus Nanohalobium constans]
MKGSYTLLIKLPEQTSIEVGSLGKIKFEPGFYMYNGSAFGPGGLKRVQRHKEKSEEGDNPHWHIDYLLVNEKSEMVKTFRKEGGDHECSLSQEMKENFTAVEDFGCSDCRCCSHLFFSAERDDVVSFLERFYS